MTLRRLVAGATGVTVATAALTLAPAAALADPLPDPVAATVVIDGPDTLGFGAQPLPLQVTVSGLADPADAELAFTALDVPPQFLVFEQQTAPDVWKPLPLSPVERTQDGMPIIDSTASLPVTNGTVTLRMGFRLDVSMLDDLEGVDIEGESGGERTLDRLANALRDAQELPGVPGDGKGSGRFETLAAAAAELFPQLLETQLVDGDGKPVGDPIETEIPVLGPTVSIDTKLPRSLEAGESFSLGLTLDNATGADFTDGPAGYDSTLSAVLAGFFTTVEESSSEDEVIDVPVAGVDEPVIDVACAPKGKELEPAGPVESEILDLIFPGLLVGKAELPHTSSASFDCEVTLAEDLPDGGLVLFPMAVVGKVGYPVAGLDLEAEPAAIEVVAAAEPTPSPTPTAPAARPTPPVDTLPDTGSTSPALAAYGALLLVTGVGVVVAARRRRTA